MPAPTRMTSAVSGIAPLRRLATRCLEDRDPLLDGHARDQLTDDTELKVVCAPKANARFAHIQLLAGLGECIAKALLMSLVAVGGHEVERVIALLRGEGDVPECLSVRHGKSRGRHAINNHSTSHRLFVAVRQIPQN